MSTHTNFHVHQREGKLGIDSWATVLKDTGHKTAAVQIRLGTDTLTVHIDNMAALEALAFELNTLVVEARSVWSQQESESEPA